MLDLSLAGNGCNFGPDLNIKTTSARIANFLKDFQGLLSSNFTSRACQRHPNLNAFVLLYEAIGNVIQPPQETGLKSHS